jgi:serine protease Do
MIMRKYFMTSVGLLPLLLTFSHAAQSVSVDSPSHTWVISSDEEGTGSHLGVSVADVTTDRLGALKLKEEKGVEVTMVDQDAPAGKAGIKEHDVILTMNGAAIESAAQLRRMIRETPPGRIVSLGLSRDGMPVTVKVQLAAVRKDKEFSLVGPDMKDFHFTVPEMHMPDIDIPPITVLVTTQSMHSGLTLENITPQLGDFFGVKNGYGVLVRNVDKGSRAEKAGLRAGDVIVKVNDQAVHDTSDFTHAVHSRKGESVSVGVIRDRKEQNLNLTLPEHKESGDLLEEESSDGEPLVQADSAFELSKLKDGLASIRPDMELALENSRKAASEIQKKLVDQQKQLCKQTEKQKEQLKKDMEHLKIELQQMRGDWL